MYKNKVVDLTRDYKCVKFINCVFTNTYDNNARFDHCLLENCEFEDMTWGIFNATDFIKCSFNKLTLVDFIACRLYNCDLSTAVFKDVNMNTVELSNCNMAGVDLTGIHFYQPQSVNDWLKTIDNLPAWRVCYTDKHLTIGCQRHTIAEWQSFSYEQIHLMSARYAIEWWAKYKDTIMSTITSNPTTSTSALIGV
jgi:hypothetical protein